MNAPPTTSEFLTTAKGLSKNPLGIIALFILLVYGFACLVVGASSQLSSIDRHIIVCFIVIFPFVVLYTFNRLVCNHTEKLYAPADYTGDEAFLKGLHEGRAPRKDLEKLGEQITEKIKSTLSGDELTAGLKEPGEMRGRLQKAAEKITSEIRASSFITIDTRPLVGNSGEVFELPYGAFINFDDLTNEIYFKNREARKAISIRLLMGHCGQKKQKHHSTCKNYHKDWKREIHRRHPFTTRSRHPAWNGIGGDQTFNIV